MNTPPRAKGDKRQRTRAKLIDATNELVREKGFDRISMEDIAKRAGMTRGAIYGNFKNKDDIFIAIGEIRGGPISIPFKPGGSFAEQMDIIAQAVIDSIPQREASFQGALSFHSYSLTHEEFRLRVRARTKEVYDFAAVALRTLLADDMPMPAETLIRVLHAMMEGLLLVRFLNPELHSDDEIRAAFAALAGPRKP